MSLQRKLQEGKKDVSDNSLSDRYKTLRIHDAKYTENAFKVLRSHLKTGAPQQLRETLSKKHD